jgi:hypothetical protein
VRTGRGVDASGYMVASRSGGAPREAASGHHCRSMISHRGYNELQLEWWEEEEKQGAFLSFHRFYC